MELTEGELKGMNHPIRQFFQRNVELPYLKSIGLNLKGKEILEVGSGSGYCASLLIDEEPNSYMGIDIMEEQLKLARERNLNNVKFMRMDVTDLQIKDSSIDIVLICGILHHIVELDKALKEIYRVLKPDGEFYVEEPNKFFVKIFMKFFNWEHEEEALFTNNELEDYLVKAGFKVLKKLKIPLGGAFKVIKN